MCTVKSELEANVVSTIARVKGRCCALTPEWGAEVTSIATPGKQKVVYTFTPKLKPGVVCTVKLEVGVMCTGHFKKIEMY